MGPDNNKLWRDRVRENSVVRQFGPKTSISDNFMMQTALIPDVLGIVRSSDDGANLPVLVVSESMSADDSPQEESSDIESGNIPDPVRKYIVLPTFNVNMANVEVPIPTESEIPTEVESSEQEKGEWPDASDIMRGMTSHKISVDSLGASLDETGEKTEENNVSYLTIPNPTAPRRPSTADIFIEKLKVEKVEGGGLSIQGVSLASNCHVTLCVFGTFFLVAGLILSYVSFSVMSPEEKEEQDRILAGGTEPPNPRKNASSVTQMRKIGPAFICIGLLMLILGISFYALAKKISRDDVAHRKMISQRHLNQLADSFRHRGTSPMHTIAPAPHEQYPILSVRRNSWWVDPTPVEQPISVDGKEIAAQYPSPLGDIQGLITPPPVSPVPSECGEEPYSDIACFPHPPPVTKTNSDPSMHSSASHHGRDANSAHSQPSSAAAHGRSLSGSATAHGRLLSGSASTVPFIQVTAAHSSISSANIQLPRLSRHCSNRTDSRPTTAETR